MGNVPLEPYTRGDAPRDAAQARWIPALDRFASEMIFVSAGFNAHREDGMRHLLWTDADYGWLTSQIVAVADRHAGGRIVSLLEGSCHPMALACSAGAHVKGLIGAR